MATSEDSIEALIEEVLANHMERRMKEDPTPPPPDHEDVARRIAMIALDVWNGMERRKAAEDFAAVERRGKVTELVTKISFDDHGAA